MNARAMALRPDLQRMAAHLALPRYCRGLATEEVYATAAFQAWACQRRFEAKGAQLSTYAWARMQGAMLDSLRREQRVARAKTALERDQPRAAEADSVSGRLDVRKAVQAVEPALDTVEKLVLQQLYFADQTEADLHDRPYSRAQIRRAHRRLLEQLSQAMQDPEPPQIERCRWTDDSDVLI